MLWQVHKSYIEEQLFLKNFFWMTTSALKYDHNIIIRKRAESIKPFWYEEVAGRWIKIKVC